MSNADEFVLRPEGELASVPLALAAVAEVLRAKGEAGVRYHVSREPSVADDEAAAWLETRHAAALFLAVFAQMVMTLRAPDNAGTTAAGGTLQATWDFDYYRWRLWVSERPDSNAVVLLERSAG